MQFCALYRRFSCKRIRFIVFRRTKRAQDLSDATQGSDGNIPESPIPDPTNIAVNTQQRPDSPVPAEIRRSEPIPPSTAHGDGGDTAQIGRNVLKFSLRTLSTVSSNIPFGAVLSSIIDPLLDIVDRIEQTSANKQGLIELAARIEVLGPIVSEVAKNDREKGCRLAHALERELQSIRTDLEAARDEGKLNQFFSSTDKASSLAKHNTSLTQLISDSTVREWIVFRPQLFLNQIQFAGVQEVLKSLQDLEVVKHTAQVRTIVFWYSDRGPSCFSSPLANFETGDVRPTSSTSSTVIDERKMGFVGGVGGSGGDARIGGEGGEGEGSNLGIQSIERWKIGDISEPLDRVLIHIFAGGTGGAGRTGVDIGRKGGDGRAPVITMLPWRDA
ncbi:hypothetical protein C8R43DRAFT_947314 [Mycena crocata]|nr:hypothetical protein C8R43DRAFT_947314 [Mycena crocata]